MHTVFVYGSLLSGLHNHSLLASAKLLGRYETRARYQLIDLGAFPGAIEGPLSESCPIKGEVYEVDDATLARLDELENHPHFYARREVYLTRLASGQPHTVIAWMYFWQMTRATYRSNRVPGGDWRAHYQERWEKMVR